ncbi:dynein light chain [Stylonychia lemnae]|uniref:Dynein light chain n=1 Tax=Stylonychia lemnae TaxID=5949 RepID=A0A078AIZ8_STYLE|nr:dynein light chain [Stylonychia lemnae]|eukprot:CDW82199.1 dynein light chain [Stylonychia lemnae]
MSKLNFKVVDMEQAMQEQARRVIPTNISNTYFQSIFEAFENLREERFIANKIRDDFDKIFGPSWNVIVGKNFGSHVVHQTKSYLFASYGDDEIYILIWKSG